MLSGPDIESMGLTDSLEHRVNQIAEEPVESEELDWELGIDDADIDMYIMTEDETKYKDGLWNKVNATYLKEQKGIAILKIIF